MPRRNIDLTKITLYPECPREQLARLWDAGVVRLRESLPDATNLEAVALRRVEESLARRRKR